MKQRIIGIDVARALAVIGMIVVNFKVVLGQKGTPWLRAVVGAFDGKAAATFVVLAGLGLALMAKSAVENHDVAKLKKIKGRILKRALFLFIVGCSYIVLWPADILHFYGVYMLVTLFFLKSTNRVIITTALAFILAFPLLMVLWDYEMGWNFNTLEYEGLWSLKGFTRNLFFNGFHPVVPWTAFMLIGYWLGKQDLHDRQFIKRTLVFSAIGFIAIQILSHLGIYLLANGKTTNPAEWIELMGTDPMPPFPLYMLNGICFALMLITACIILAKRFADKGIVHALHKTGQLALTFYVAHVILGMGLVEVIAPNMIGNCSITFSVTYALLFSALCVRFAVVWRRNHPMGPLEAMMRKLTY